MDVNYDSRAYMAAKEYCFKREKSYQDVVDSYSSPQGEKTLKEIEKEIYRRISETITPSEKAILDCNIGLSESIHDAVFSGQQGMSREYRIIYRLRDVIRGIRNDDVITSPERENWISAISLSDEFNTLKGPLPTGKFKDRDWDTSVAVFNLSNNGVDFEFNNGDYFFTKDGKDKVQQNLQGLIDKIGGEKIINFLFEYEEKDYSEYAERFIHLPESAKVSVAINKHALPSNMVLNLALKNVVSTENNIGEIGKELDRGHFNLIKRKAIEVAKVFDCEPYGHFEYLNIPASKLAKVLLEFSLYTGMYQFVQMDPRLAKKILYKLKLNYGETDVDGVKIKDVCLFLEGVISVAPEKKSLIKRSKNFKKMPVFSGLKDLNTLIKITSIGKEDVNSSYFIPAERSDYLFYPLINTVTNKILILPKPIVANAVVERVFSLIRKTSASGVFTNSFGKNQLEEILREVHYETHGISILQGKILGTVYETDGVIVTKDDIHIFESKMKTFVQASRAGDDVSIINDLVKSLLYSQSQMMDIEHEIRLKGFIEIADSSGVHKVELSGRNVRRHTLVLHDYGMLQHKQIVFNFLISLLQYGFNHPHEDRNKILSSLEVEIERFRNSFKKLHGIDALPENNPLHHSSFVNFSDVFCIINMANNEDEYLNLLNSIDSVVFGMAPPVYSAIGRYNLQKKVAVKNSKKL